MDNEFKKLRNLVPILAINTTAVKEHVPEVEHKIWLIKEWGRGILNTHPFKRMPRLMLIELIYHVVLWLNAFPSKSEVSETLDFAKHCRLLFGTYCEVHDEPSPTNSMVTCSTPPDSARPYGQPARNLQVLQLGDGQEGQATRVHTVPHARVGHQEG